MSFFVIILYINILKQFWYKVSSLIHIVFLYSDTLLVFYSFFYCKTFAFKSRLHYLCSRR